MRNAFTWVVQFKVAPLWVADGYSICDDRALSMLSHQCSSAVIGDELGARVLCAPSPLRIVREQGYGLKDPRGGIEARRIIADAPYAHRPRVGLHAALMQARQLIDSVAFVKTEGDKTPVLKVIDAALRDLA